MVVHFVWYSTKLRTLICHSATGSRKLTWNFNTGWLPARILFTIHSVHCGWLSHPALKWILSELSMPTMRVKMALRIFCSKINTSKNPILVWSSNILCTYNKGNFFPFHFLWKLIDIYSKLVKDILKSKNFI